MFGRRVLPDLVLLRTLTGHAGVAASAFGAVGSAVAAHARAAEIRAIVVSGLQVGVVVIAACGCDSRTILSRVGILDPVIPTNQAMVPVVAAVRLVSWIRARLILVPAAVRPEIAIRVIAAVRAIVRVFARLIITVRVKGSIVAIPGMVLRSGRSVCPRVIAIVVSGMPGVIRDVGVVVEDDGVATAASAPVASPGVKAPAEAGADRPASTTEGYARACRTSLFRRSPLRVRIQQTGN